MKNYMNIEELELIIKKIELYQKEEKKFLTNTKELFREILLDYKTENTNKINELQNEVINKFSIIEKTRQNSIDTLTKKMINYQENQKKTELFFKEII